MSYIVIIRCYKPGDEINCKELLKTSIMSSMTATFFGTLCKEVVFQMMILFAAVMFIFFGLPFSTCFLVIPIVILLVYVGTYLEFTMKTMEIDKEVSNIPRMYMSNAFSCFWVAEAFEPYLMTRHPKEVHYTIMTEQQFYDSNINLYSQAKKIVGTVCLSKNNKVNTGAWIKRLCVHKEYKGKGIASSMLNTAVQFAIDQGYSSANMVASEYTEGGRELALKKGFELKQMYHKPILSSFITVLMYELTYQIKPGSDNYVICQ